MDAPTTGRSQSGVLAPGVQGVKLYFCSTCCAACCGTPAYCLRLCTTQVGAKREEGVHLQTGPGRRRSRSGVAGLIVSWHWWMALLGVLSITNKQLKPTDFVQHLPHFQTACSVRVRTQRRTTSTTSTLYPYTVSRTPPLGDSLPPPPEMCPADLRARLQASLHADCSSVPV